MKETCECCKKEKDTKNMIHYCNYPVPGGTIKFIVCKNCDSINDKWAEMIADKWTKMKEDKK